MRTRDSAQVGPPRSDDGVDVVSFKDVADSDGRNAYLVANAIGERHLEHASIDRLFRFAHLAGRAVNHVCARSFEQARYFGSIFRCEAARHPVMGRDAYAYGTVLRPSLAHGTENLQRIAEQIFEGT